MSAFSTISALRRRRPEGLPEGNAAAGGGLQGVACRERLAGGACRGRLAGSALLGGVPRRGRLAGGVGGPPPRPRDVPASGSPLRPAPARSGPTSPATGRLSGLSSPQGTSPLRSVAPPPERPLPPARLHFGDAPPPPHARNHATSQPHNPATSQPRNLATPQPRNHAATQPPQPLSHAKRALPAWGEPFCIGMASCAYPRNESRIPAATAEPTTPATLGPMACISR